MTHDGVEDRGMCCTVKCELGLLYEAAKPSHEQIPVILLYGNLCLDLSNVWNANNVLDTGINEGL
jgi:hypothetical protein